MGTTISYRGRLKELARIEVFEDVVMDLAMELGGDARVWRSAAKGRKGRIVRGVIVNLAPGVEPISLLVSPEGWLISAMDIAAAERKPVRKAPWIAVKTQYGPIEAHVAVCELLVALGKEFLEDLEIHDEGGWWPDRDLTELKRRLVTVDGAVRWFAAELTGETVHPEDRDDPDLLAKRVERIGKRIRRLAARPPEHGPVRFADHDDPGADPDTSGTEAEWDAMFRDQRRKQEKMTRLIDERTLSGASTEKAFDEAMSDPGMLDVPDAGVAAYDEASKEEADEDAMDVKEMNRICEEAVREVEEKKKARAPRRPKRHPLQERMHELTLRALRLEGRKGAGPDGPVSQIVQGILEMSGGLAQVLGSHAFGDDDEEDDDGGMAGLNVVQLKRALRGAAFALGALAPAAAAKRLKETDAAFIRKEGEAIAAEMRKRLDAERARLKGKGGR